MYKQVFLLPGKEANIAFRHPWLFSGALQKAKGELEHGDLVSVMDKYDKVLATGTYSNKTSIAVRALAFGDAVIDRAWFANAIRTSNERRLMLGYGPGTETTGYRVCFGESDGISGLVVDRYEDVIVFQISTAGLDRLREEIIGALKDVFAPRSIIERSDMPMRKEEALEPVVGLRFGEAVEAVPYKENGITFTAHPMTGQKTGAFLDQKILRKLLLGGLLKGMNGLNLFSYTGSTGIAAMKGGAEHIHNMDGSAEAIQACMDQAKEQGIAAEAFTTEKNDIFQWLAHHETGTYDFVIVDPPALIKNAKDSEEGKKAYHFLNRAAMRLVRNGGILITSSCSRFFLEEDLAFTLRRASVQAGVDLRVLETIRQSPDHPFSVYFPEAAYLKTFVCRVERNG